MPHSSRIRICLGLLIVGLVVAALIGSIPLPALADQAGPEEFGRLDYFLFKAFNDGDYERALQIAKRMHALRPGHGNTLYNLAVLHNLLGHTDEANAWLRRASEALGLRHESMENIKNYISMLERPERDAIQKPDQVMAALAFRQGERVADIGAGSGYFTLRVAEAVGPTGTVWAIDVLQPMLDHIERRLQAENLKNVKLALVPKDDPRLPAGSVDTILMVDTLHFVEDRVDYAKRMRAALAPGGRVVIIDYIPKTWEERPWGPRPHIQISRESVDEDMARAGLKPIKVHHFLPEQYFVEYAVN